MRYTIYENEKKKHREERLDACADFLIDNIEDFKNDPSVFFETKKQMKLEISCGKGRFITETAKLNPDVNFISVEKMPMYSSLRLKKQRMRSLQTLNLCAVAENTRILARHLLHRNFSFCKNPFITAFCGKKTEPQFCIKITVQIWWAFRDSNPGPTGYEPVALTN